MLRALQTKNLLMEIEKCKFYKQSIKFLEFILIIIRIQMNKFKITVIFKWSQFILVKELQLFLGFINFYQRFIISYSRVIILLTQITRKKIFFI